VSAVDRNDELLAHIRLVAVRESLMVTTECRDLETGAPDFGSAAFSAVLVFNYLHRPLVPALTGALAAGGLLLYETFTIGQRERGHPRNPDFLLRDGELRELFADLEILRYREGDYDGRLIASLAARKT
jgi:hypothetical protein